MKDPCAVLMEMLDRHPEMWDCIRGMEMGNGTAPTPPLPPPPPPPTPSGYRFYVHNPDLIRVFIGVQECTGGGPWGSSSLVYEDYKEVWEGTYPCGKISVEKDDSSIPKKIQLTISDKDETVVYHTAVIASGNSGAEYLDTDGIGDTEFTVRVADVTPPPTLKYTFMVEDPYSLCYAGHVVGMGGFQSLVLSHGAVNEYDCNTDANCYYEIDITAIAPMSSSAVVMTLLDTLTGKCCSVRPRGAGDFPKSTFSPRTTGSRTGRRSPYGSRNTNGRPWRAYG